jgi:hypothetical protein
MEAMEGLVRVYASADTVEGELRRGFLEAEGVPVIMKGGTESPYRLGPVYLFVPESYEMKARVLLDAVASGAFAAPDEELAMGEDAPDGSDPNREIRPPSRPA